MTALAIPTADGRIQRDHPEQTWRQWREKYADAVIYDGPGPFSGLTVAKAALIRDTLYGYPVRVLTHNLKRDHRGAEFGILVDITLPGDWQHDPITAIGDVRVLTEYPSESMFSKRYVGHGSARVMGPGAIVEFDVIAPEPWFECNDCSAFRPRDRLFHLSRDTWGWTPEDFECNRTWEWVCRKQSAEGYCR